MVDVQPQPTGGDERARSRAMAVVRAGARGLVGAMAMTGALTFRPNTRPLPLSSCFARELLPGEHEARAAREGAARGDQREARAASGAQAVGGPRGRRRRAGAPDLRCRGGSGSGMFPERCRRSHGAGPLYRFAIWLAFEVGVAPVLGIARAERRTVVIRLMLVADHVL